MQRNVKLILILLFLGIALLVIGLTRMSLGDTNGQGAPASLTASSITGLVGLGVMAAGLFQLRVGSVEVSARLAAKPPTQTLRPGQSIAIIAGAIAAVAAVAVGFAMASSHAPSRPASTPKADPVPSTTRDGSIPAPTPDVPKSYQPR